MDLLWTLIIGGLAGFIAGKIMRGEGFGIIVDIIVGIVGGWLGGWVFDLIGVHSGGVIGRLLIAIVGAVILIWLIRLIKRA